MMATVAKNLDTLEGDQADIFQVVQSGEEGPQLRFLVDDFDHHRKVVVQTEWPMIVQPSRLPESLAAPQHRGAGEAGVSRALHNDVRQGTVAQKSMLIRVDAKQDRLAGHFHVVFLQED